MYIYIYYLLLLSSDGNRQPCAGWLRLVALQLWPFFFDLCKCPAPKPWCDAWASSGLPCTLACSCWPSVSSLLLRGDMKLSRTCGYTPKPFSFH